MNKEQGISNDEGVQHVRYFVYIKKPYFLPRISNKEQGISNVEVLQFVHVPCINKTRLLRRILNKEQGISEVEVIILNKLSFN